MTVEGKEAQGLDAQLNQILQREGQGLVAGKGGELTITRHRAETLLLFTKRIANV